MFGLDLLARTKIGDGPRNFENPVVGPGGKGQAPDRHFEGPFGGAVQRAQLAQPARRHIGVDESALRLARPRGQDPLAHFRRCRAGPAAAHLLVGHGGHFDVQVDAVQRRPADLAQVTLDDAAGATAFVGRVAEVTTRTPVQVSTAT